MATWQEKLEKAIISGNMEGVRAFYKYTFDKEAPKGPKLVSEEEVDKRVQIKIGGLVESINSIVCDTLGSTKPKKGQKKSKVEEPEPEPENEEVETDEDDSEVSVDPFTTEKAGKFHTGESRTLKFVTGTTNLDAIDGYKEAVDKLGKRSKNTPNRNPYKPKMMTCSCGKKFDYNKEYPVGQVVPDIAPRCGKCNGSKN